MCKVANDGVEINENAQVENRNNHNDKHAIESYGDTTIDYGCKKRRICKCDRGGITWVDL